MGKAAKITAYVVSALAVAGLAALAVPAFSALGQAAELTGGLVRTLEPTTTAVTANDGEPEPEVTMAPGELPDWAAKRTPWFVYPDGYCDGTRECPNDFRATFGGKPCKSLPDGVQYFDHAAQAPNPNDKSSWCVKAVDRGPSEYASGEVVRGDGVHAFEYRVAPGDTLTGIGERFCFPPVHLSGANRDLINSYDALEPGTVLTLRGG